MINQPKQLLQIVASAENYSQHPIATAIKNKNKLPLLETTNYKEISGKGISCKVDNKKVLVGNEKLLKDHKIIILPVEEEGTIIHISIDDEYAGYIVISDRIKKSSTKIKELAKKYNKELIILSGDINKVVSLVAAKLGIKKYHSDLLPQDKVEIVENLKKSGKVLFVGDGINDAPVIYASDIGVSMGQIGSDAAIESSDIVIMKDDLRKLKTSFEIAKLTRKKVVQTMIFAITAKVVVLLLGALGISTIWMAVFADVGVTLLSVLNVLTIMWKKL